MSDYLSLVYCCKEVDEFGRELDLFRGLSFTTISSSGPNGGEQSLAYKGLRGF